MIVFQVKEPEQSRKRKISLKIETHTMYIIIGSDVFVDNKRTRLKISFSVFLERI